MDHLKMLKYMVQEIKESKDEAMVEHNSFEIDMDKVATFVSNCLENKVVDVNYMHVVMFDNLSHFCCSGY